MFKKENRLVTGTRFGRAYFSIAPQFILKEKENSLEINRYGIVVSKKIDKRAVVRNKIKRMFRQALLELSGKMTLGHDILLVTKKNALSLGYEENLLAVEKTLKKAGIIKNEEHCNINH